MKKQTTIAIASIFAVTSILAAVQLDVKNGVGFYPEDSEGNASYNSKDYKEGVGFYPEDSEGNA